MKTWCLRYKNESWSLIHLLFLRSILYYTSYRIMLSKKQKTKNKTKNKKQKTKQKTKNKKQNKKQNKTKKKKKKKKKGNLDPGTSGLFFDIIQYLH